MVELVDTEDSKSSAERRAGSSPAKGTNSNLLSSSVEELGKTQASFDLPPKGIQVQVLSGGDSKFELRGWRNW